MKTKDLMIGDLIEVAFGDGTWRCVCVDELCYMDHSDTVYIVYKDMNGERNYISRDASDDAIRGIELTEELLLKNGFVGSGYLRLNFVDDKHKYYEYYPFEHRLILYYEGIDEWQNNAHVKEVLFRCPCRYVHELQHAFKMWDDFAYLADKIIV